MTTDLPITRDRVLQEAQALPAAPQVLGGLCELLEDVNTHLGVIAEEIRGDPALAVRVIRLSNSVTFGRGAPVGSIEEAVSRVGVQEIVRIVGVATVAGLVDRALATYDVDAPTFRQALLFHALAAEAIARHTGIDPRVAYTAGLLRGVGIMVLDRVGRGRMRRADAFNAKLFPSYCEWEQERFGLTSSQVTAEILDAWHFPDPALTAIQHHLLLGPGAEGNVLAHVLYLAGAAVAGYGCALPGEKSCWVLTTEKLGVAGLDAERWKAAAERAYCTFERQRRLL